jgi:hypothetical protein
MSARWTKEQANAWYEKLPWLVGCNFIPSNAINQLEMFQNASFDPQTIDRELGWAAELGFNTMRVYLHDLLWEADAEGFKKTIDQYLEISTRHNITTLFTLFDDCWNDEASLGKQPDPKLGVHNSGWLQSPGKQVVNDPSQWGRLEKYVKGVLSTFGRDERILMWDVYNEPGNSGQGVKSIPLLEKAFEWAREANPQQPLTSGVWDYDLVALNSIQLSNSDVISFHRYESVNALRKNIAELKGLGRPLICTEYMARTAGSTFDTHLPVFKSEKVGCYNWGLVAGKSNTIFAWGKVELDPEPQIWFHDIFRTDHSPYSRYETALIAEILKDKKIW